MILSDLFEISAILLILTIIKVSGIESINKANGHSLSLVPNKYNLTPGSEIILTCRMKSNSEPTVEWLRNGETFPNKLSPKARVNGLKIIVQDDENPEFPAYRSDLYDYPDTAKEYIYTCIFRNHLGENRMPIAITVGNKPRIISLILKPASPQPKGRNISATCKIQSEAKLETKWFYVNEFDSKNGHSAGVEIMDQSEEDTFDIEKYVEDDDRGLFVSTLFFLPVSIDANYTCQAQNVFGKTYKRIEVKTVDLDIGDPCKQDLECGSSLRNADCIRGVCSCPDDFSIYVKSLKACLTPVSFRDKCEHDLQCKDTDKNTYCTIQGRETCQCSNGFLYSVAKRQCIEAKAEHTYRNVLLAIGSTLALIVSATLTLYFARKYLEKKRLSKILRRANLSLVSDSLNDNPSRNKDEENGKKKVHFTQ